MSGCSFISFFHKLKINFFILFLFANIHDQKLELKVCILQLLRVAALDITTISKVVL